MAWSLARGHGYAFEGSWRWLGPFTAPGTYSPTAWVEPVHTGLMALSFRTLGEGGRLVLVSLNLVWAMATVVAVFFLGRRLAGPPAGVAAALLLTGLITRYELPLSYIGGATLPGLLIVCCALMLVRCVESFSVSRAVALGLTIGLTNLTHASTMSFAPLSALGIVLLVRPRCRRVWLAAALVPLVASVVIAPWTIRNYLTFGEFVPLRTGSGTVLHPGIPGLASTFATQPGSGDRLPEPPWRAGGAREAVSKLDQQHVREIVAYSIHTIEADPPPGYEHYNEAQRDAVLGARARRFAWSHPWLLARLVGAKALSFFFMNWRLAGLVTLIAVLGLLTEAHRSRGWLVTMLVAAFSVPYLLGLPVYYRYRYPMDPLVCVLAGLCWGWLVERRSVTRWTRAGSWSGG